MSEISESEIPSTFLKGAQGVGPIDAEMVETRAKELAKIDGRTEVNEGDRILAREDLVHIGSHPEAPEAADSATGEITEWDEAPEASGMRAPTVRPEDEVNIAQSLIEEGIEEADHEQRLASVEENPPEEA